MELQKVRVIMIRQDLLASVPDPAQFIHTIRRACLALIDAEPEITRQDLIAGDGDAGHTLRSGALAVLQAIESNTINGSDVITDMAAVSEAIERSMGGTSGALYA
jgi:dihydroxyacetone kinase